MRPIKRNMKKMTITFKNLESVDMLIASINAYRESQLILCESIRTRTQEYYNALLRVSLLNELHNELYRYMYRDAGAKYPSSKSFNLHKAIVLQESLQFNQISSTPYLQNAMNMILAEVNQQLES